MDCIKEDHMVRFKAGQIKDSEQFVYCKLLAADSSSCPKILGFTDGSLSRPEFTIKVAAFTPVKENDKVPKVVKAKYDNYICIRGEGDSVTYLRADNRKQKDEWCAVVQAEFEKDVASSNAIRCRLSTDPKANRPTPNRTRRGGGTITAPPSAEGIFHQQLVDISHGNNCDSSLSSQDDKEIKLCCPKRHEVAFHHDGRNMVEHDEVIYENVHFIRDQTQWKAKQIKARHCLTQSEQLYSGLQLLKTVQADDVIYETPKPPTSVQTQESTDGSPLQLPSDDYARSKIPEESSWPGSPVTSPNESPDPSINRCKPKFIQELETALSRNIPENKEPVAKMCLSDEPIYENYTVKRSQMGNPPAFSGGKSKPNPPKVKPRLNSLENAQKADCHKHVFPGRSTENRRSSDVSSKPPLPTRNVPPITAPRNSPLRLAEQTAKVKTAVKLEIDKSVLLRCIHQPHDTISTMNISCDNVEGSSARIQCCVTLDLET